MSLTFFDSFITFFICRHTQEEEKKKKKHTNNRTRRKMSVSLALVLSVVVVVVVAAAIAIAVVVAGQRRSRNDVGARDQNGTPTVTVVSATGWCGYSKKFSDQLGEIKAALGSATDVVHLQDADAGFEAATQKYGISGFPSSVVMSHGRVLGTVVGYRSTDAFVTEVRNLLGNE